MTLKVLDLFSGIGGFAIAAHWAGFKTAQFVEIDPSAQTELRYHYPHIPIHDDVRTYQPIPGKFDIITAGFPCTGTSGAGLKTGLSHAESALFRDTLRIIYESRPRFTIIENPTGLRDRGLRAVLGGLRMAGYSSELIVISAGRLGAGHRRQRLFIVSYPHVGSGNPTITDISRSSEMRAMVSEARNYADWLQVKPGSNGKNDGLPVVLVRHNFSAKLKAPFFCCDNGQQGRLTARILAGRAVTPQQALIPFLRIKELANGQKN